MRWLLYLLTPLFLSGCMSMDIATVSQTEPKLDLKRYFDGKVYAWGIFEDRFGKVRRQFLVEIDGQLDGEQLILNEKFLYNDGERATRVWTINEASENRFSGTAPDILNQAEGEVSGNTLNWRYTMDLPVGDSTWRVDFDDWMLLQQGGVLLNRAFVKKWGVTLGSVTLSFMRADQLKEVPFSL